MIADRYRAAGLERNPFITGPHDDALDGSGDALFVSRGLPDPPPPGSGALVQVVGDRGAGKSTHLHRWRRATAGPYHYVPRLPVRERWRVPPIAVITYADEVDRLPTPIRWRWFRRLARVGATAVVGSHADLAPAARRAGLEVITHHLGPVDRPTLDAIIDARLRAAAIHTLVATHHGERAADREPARFAFGEAELAEIHHRSGGSVRRAEIEGHKLVANRLR